MNTRPKIAASNEPAVLSVAFNNDASRFSVGLNNGFNSTCRRRGAVTMRLVARPLPPPAGAIVPPRSDDITG